MKIKEFLEKLQKIEDAKFTIRNIVPDDKNSNIHMVYLSCESDNLINLKGKVPEDIVELYYWVNNIIEEKDNIHFFGQPIEIEEDEYYTKGEWKKTKLSNVKINLSKV